MQNADLPAWALVNLLVPVLGPIVILSLLGLSKRQSTKYPNIVFEALRYGALFWTVLGMCAAAIYDAWGKGGTGSFADVMAGVSSAWHMTLIGISCGAVLLGAMDSVDEVPGTNDGKADRGIYRASIWATGVTTLTYGATHFFYA